MKKQIFKIFILHLFLLISCKGEEKTVIKVSFYNVKEETINFVENSLTNKIKDKKHCKIHFESVIDASVLRKMVENKELDLIFSNTRALPFDDAYIECFDSTYFQDLPDVIKTYSKDTFKSESASYMHSIQTNSMDISKNKYLLCPLLIEPYCLAIHNSLAKKMGLGQLKEKTKKYTREDFEALLKECGNKYALMLSAGDDETFSFFLSFVMKMVHENEIEKIEYTNLKEMKNEIQSTLNTVLEWQKKGYFHPEWFRLKKEDVSMFMEMENAGIVFIKQNEYENLSKIVKDSYELIPFPLAISSSQNYQPCAILSAVKITSASKEKSECLNKIVSYCLTQDWQREMEGLTEYTSLLSFAQNKNQSYLMGNAVLYDVNTLLLENIDQSRPFMKEIRYYFSIAGLGY